ncbi:hypothetical protein [Devosia sp.]|uniref:hypothetical protein n=1 Tax=Devosia sp. TaxID=1871048 RepID=UPI003A8F5941
MAAFRVLVALVLMACLSGSQTAMAQAPHSDDASSEVIELLRGGTNFQQLVERSRQEPGADWRSYIAMEDERLEDLLHANGYLDGRLDVEASTAPGTDQTLKIQVEPGPLYHIAAVRLDGLETRSPSIDQILADAAGKVASTEQAGAISRKLVWALGEQGRPFVRVSKSAFARVGAPAEAVLNLTLDVPPPARFAALEIEGGGGELVEKIRSLQPFAASELYSISKVASFRDAVLNLAGGGSARVDAEVNPDSTFDIRVRRISYAPKGGSEVVVGILILLATLVVVSRKRFILSAGGTRSGLRLNPANLAVAALLCTTAVLVLGRALSFISGSA